ncbi:hypothetical protein ACM64Y_01845 [Novispirillum sp. DQ9]|uniref:hypothetical protein n=1 Tax=Novispirillum sp. DQ9 TaxID=3398612 RepID=UPI003C7AF646
MKKLNLKQSLAAGAAAISTTVVAASAAHAGPIGDAVTAATTAFADAASDMGGMTVLYLGVIGSLGAVLIMGGLLRKALGGGR